MIKISMIAGLFFTTACGISPEQAVDGLEDLANDPSTCGYEGVQAEQEEIEKFFLPNGYGITSTYGCSSSATWPGLKCLIPFSKQFRMKIAADGQDPNWVAIVDEARDSVVIIANSNGWDIENNDGPAPFQLRTSTSVPEGWLGTIKTSLVETISAGSQGDFKVHGQCKAMIYRDSVEANWAYQASSAAQRARYVRNLFRHEMYHCLGLAHSNGSFNTLMSQNYGFPGPYFDTALQPTVAEQQRLEDFQAHY
jgi:hypothetical protein